jgi:hypothetical protein
MIHELIQTPMGLQFPEFKMRENTMLTLGCYFLT